MELDRFKYNDEGESPEEFSTCANGDCREIIHVGDKYINYYGSICCLNLRCLLAVTDAKIEIAGDESKL